MPPFVRAAVLALGIAATMSTVVPPAHADDVPQDPAASGSIGFCDLQNRPVTGGPVNGTPFVWKAVASTPAPKDYQGRGQNAVLNIFQPRPDTGPGDWSGDQLTATTFYQDSTHPTVVATSKDIPLSVIVAEYPPQVDGLYEVRMAFGKTNYGVYSATYPAVFIRVTGNSWSVVNGGAVDCTSGTGQSAEVLTGTVSKQDATKIPDSASVAPPPPAASKSGGRSASASGSGSPTTTASTSSTVSAASTQSSDSASASAAPTGHAAPTSTASSSDTSLWVGLVVVAGLLGAGGMALRRRRALSHRS